VDPGDAHCPSGQQTQVGSQYVVITVPVESPVHLGGQENIRVAFKMVSTGTFCLPWVLAAFVTFLENEKRTPESKYIAFSSR